MGGLLERIGQESGLIALVGVAVFLVAVPVVFLRIRSGRAVWQSIWLTALEAGMVACLIGILTLTLGSFGFGGLGSVNLVPFRSLIDSFSLGDYWVGIVLVDLAGNFLLYFPLGLFVALRIPGLSLWTWALAVFTLTAGIEVLQGVALNRSADITDVLMNGLGGVAGFLLVRAVQHLLSKRSFEGPEAKGRS